MESVQTIQARIAPLAWRVRWTRGVRWSIQGILFSLLGALPLLLLMPILPGPSGLWLAGAIITGAGGGFCYGLARPVPLFDLARLVEERLGLEARLSTALECHGRRDQSAFALALYRDALRRLPDISGREILPLRLPRECWSVLPAAAAVLLLWMVVPLSWHPFTVLPRSPREGRPREEAVQPEADVGLGPPVSAGAPGIRREQWRAANTPFSRITRDTNALFKDSPLTPGQSDFSSFLLEGDERLKFLGRSQAIPDLKGEDFRGPYQTAVQRMQEMSKDGARRLTLDEARRLLTDVQRMGKEGGIPGSADSRSSEKLADPTGERTRAALARALEWLRQHEEDRLRSAAVPKESGVGVPGGGRSGSEATKGDAPPLPEPLGPFPGTGRSRSLRGIPTPRLEASPRDTTLKGETGGGRTQSYNTNLLSAGREGKSVAPTLEVLFRYRQLMEEALSREPIPPDYREQVKTYFDSLLPRKRGSGQ